MITNFLGILLLFFFFIFLFFYIIFLLFFSHLFHSFSFFQFHFHKCAFLYVLFFRVKLFRKGGWRGGANVKSPFGKEFFSDWGEGASCPYINLPKSFFKPLTKIKNSFLSTSCIFQTLKSVNATENHNSYVNKLIEKRN